MKSSFPGSSLLNVINKPKPVAGSGRGNPDAMGLFSFIDSSLFPARQACVTKPSYTLAPQITAGSYRVDEKLNRTSLTAGTNRSSVLSGTTMTLTIQLYNNNALTCCSNPAHNVQVEIWHCDANGLYADVAASNTGANPFLRGYQGTDNEGRVTFTTIYPGWHSGRAPHIHLRASVYDSVANASYNFVAQLFFADDFTDEIYAMTPYNFRGGRDTRNSNDMVYRDADTPLVVTAEYTTAESGTELVAEIAIGLSGLPANTQCRDLTVTARNEERLSVPFAREAACGFHWQCSKGAQHVAGGGH